MELLEQLAKLSRAGAVHGHEGTLAAALAERWRPWLDESHVDPLGNFVGLARGQGPQPRPKVLAAAHMDTVGLMVTRVEPGGFLRVTPVGSVDRRLLWGQEVEVLGRRHLVGIVGAKPPHLSAPEERVKVPPLEELYVDVGLPEDEVKELAGPGTVLLFRRDLVPLRNGRAAGRYLDDTAGLAAIGVALEELFRARGHAADFYAVGTVGEESAHYAGASAAAFELKPDLAVAIDVTFGAASPDDDPDRAFPLGGGPVIGVGPNCHPKLVALLRQTATEANIGFGFEVMPGRTGTDAWAMQVTRGGVPTAVLSVPLRYMHTPVETLSVDDVRNAGRLLAEAVRRVTRTFVEELSCY